MKSKLTSGSTNGGENGPHHSHTTSSSKAEQPSSIQSIEVVKDNIYLKGGNSLAEAMMNH
jgi:hypothetical protein